MKKGRLTHVRQATTSPSAASEVAADTQAATWAKGWAGKRLPEVRLTWTASSSCPRRAAEARAGRSWQAIGCLAWRVLPGPLSTAGLCVGSRRCSLSAYRQACVQNTLHSLDLQYVTVYRLRVWWRRLRLLHLKCRMPQPLDPQAMESDGVCDGVGIGYFASGAGKRAFGQRATRAETA